MAYNLTELQNSETVYQIFLASNNASNSILSTVIIFSIFFILLLAIRTNDFPGKLAVSSFISGVFSAMLWYMELLNPIIPLFFAAMTAITTAYLYWRN